MMYITEDQEAYITSKYGMPAQGLDNLIQSINATWNSTVVKYTANTYMPEDHPSVKLMAMLTVASKITRESQHGHQLSQQVLSTMDSDTLECFIEDILSL